MSQALQMIKRALMTKTVLFGGGLLFSLVGGNAFWAWHIERRRIPRVVEKFEAGSKRLEVLSNEEFFPRKETTALKGLSTPKPGFFNLVTGEHGTGKTTLVRYVCKNSPDRVIYIRVPDDPALLAPELSKTVDFDPKVYISFWSVLRTRFFTREESPKPSPLNLVLDGISSASQHFSAKHKKPAVLFIDNLTILAKKDKDTFERLVRFAKTEADSRHLVVNFVASEGNTPRQLQELSESSRLAEIVEVGDLDQQDALKFLTRKGVDEKTAKEIINIAGGRITLLNEAHLRAQKGQSFKYIQRAFEQRGRQEFGDLVLPQDISKVTPKQKEAWMEITKIMDSPTKEIPFREFQKSLGSLTDDLLKRNVFAYHHSKDSVSLQSRPAELYVESEIGTPDSEQRRKLLKLIK